jgi:hypothetical protein
MTEVEYSYAILKYRHDSAAGEVLNVGVAIYAPDSGVVAMCHDPRYSRLSQTFANFDGEMYRKVLGKLQMALATASKPLSGELFVLEARESIADIGVLIRKVWPDQGLSYFHGPVVYGVTNDVGEELEHLFDRFVVSQSDPRDARERFNDQQLWGSFEKALSSRGILQVLKPVTIGSNEIEFEKAYKNDRWHVFEPLSLDYLDGTAMKRRAFEVAGKAASVRDSEEVGVFTVILGPPRRAGSSKPFFAARQILEGAPGQIRVVDEDKVEGFAAQLESELRSHGLIQ